MCVAPHINRKQLYLGVKWLLLRFAWIFGQNGPNMGHNGHGINKYGVVMVLMGNLYSGRQSN